MVRYKNIQRDFATVTGQIFGPFKFHIIYFVCSDLQLCNPLGYGYLYARFFKANSHDPSAYKCELIMVRSLSNSIIWRPSRVADTPPLLPISWYSYRLFVADIICLCSEVLQSGGSWSSSVCIRMHMVTWHYLPSVQLDNAGSVIQR